MLIIIVDVISIILSVVLSITYGYNHNITLSILWNINGLLFTVKLILDWWNYNNTDFLKFV